MAIDLGISLFTSAGILLLLALVTTTLRCVTRGFIVKAFGPDDWLMIVTVVSFYIHTAKWTQFILKLTISTDTVCPLLLLGILWKKFG